MKNVLPSQNFVCLRKVLSNFNAEGFVLRGCGGWGRRSVLGALQKNPRSSVSAKSTVAQSCFSHHLFLEDTLWSVFGIQIFGKLHTLIFQIRLMGTPFPHLLFPLGQFQELFGEKYWFRYIPSQMLLVKYTVHSLLGSPAATVSEITVSFRLKILLNS